MKICVLGAGSLGCTFGAALTLAGSEVWLVTRSQAHVAAMQQNGLVLVGNEKEPERSIAVNAATSCEGLGPVDLLIVLVKSFETSAAIRGAAQVIGKHTVVLSLQNGLGHEEVLSDAIGQEHVMAGKTYVGGMLVGPGKLVSRTDGKQTFIGELSGRISERAIAIAAEFNRAGLQTSVSSNILETIWDKLLVNCATGALSGITRLDYGALYSIPALKATALAAITEAMHVARAAGVGLGFADAEAPWRAAAEGLPAEFKASMLQSIEKGSRTEIDFVNGAVVRLGIRHGVATPVNSALVSCIKGIEHSLGLPRVEMSA